MRLSLFLCLFMISGHLALSILLHRHGRTEPILTLVGSYFPDLCDKTLRYTLGLTRSGRYIGHTLPAWAVTTVLVDRAFGRSAARTWALAYLGHLLADSAGRVPWFYPFKNYPFRRSRSLWTRLRDGSLLRPEPAEMWLWLLVLLGQGSTPKK